MSFACLLLLFQVYLKYPEVSLTLPIYIGNVAVDPTLPSSSRPVPPMPAPRNNPTPAPSPAAAPAETALPSLPPKPAPKPRPRSCYAVSPSAPPADLYPELPGVANDNGENTRSPQIESGSQAAVSPNAFSYAPGLSFRKRQNGLSALPLSSSSSPQDTNRNQMSSSASLPPNYRSSAYPPGMGKSFHWNIWKVVCLLVLWCDSVCGSRHIKSHCETRLSFAFLYLKCRISIIIIFHWSFNVTWWLIWFEFFFFFDRTSTFLWR